jgi:glyoxylase-like metal-dependent hydrolase (beta-lactamase superfamily II)
MHRHGNVFIELQMSGSLVSGQIDVIAPGVRRLVATNGSFLTGAGTNTYLLGNEKFLVLDPGPADDAHIERILKCTQGRIAAIVVTHTHEDHSPAARPLAAATGAALLGQTIADDGHQDLTFKPTCQLDDGDCITLEKLRLRVIHTPGHVGNQLCLLLEDSGLLFTGDHLNQGTTVVIVPPSGSMSEYLRSLRQLQHSPVQRIAPGHGEVIDDAQAEIARVIEHRLRREAKVLTCLRAAGSVTLEELLPRVYDDVAAYLWELAKLSLLAHLIKLQEDRLAVRTADDRWQMKG